MEFLTENVTNASVIAAVISLIGLAFAWQQRKWVLAQDPGSEAMQKISSAVQDGAKAFMTREYRAIVIFVIVVAIILYGLSFIEDSGMSPWTTVAFLSGAIASGLSGWGGMYIAVRANSRTTQAASDSLNKGLRVAFSSGMVMGTMVVSLVVFGVSILFALFAAQLDDPKVAVEALAGFGFGGTSIAIFSRIGGGIFTKAADVGADLVGKTEAGIPEDDPRNPATIADNVGDNVGDVAGLGSDLFESYASSIIAAVTLAVIGGYLTDDQRIAGQVYPILLAAAGLIVGILCSSLVKTEDEATQAKLLQSLRNGVYAATVSTGVVVVVLVKLLELPDGVIYATMAGLFSGVFIGYFTEYFTSDHYQPTRDLAKSAEGGAGIVVIRGLALGMFSTIAPVLIVVIVTLLAYNAAELYGIAIAAVGMLSTLGITLATDAYGPVADNAGGIAEMCHLPAEVRERTDALDSLGNTTAATGKGFAIGSAGMTALALTAAFITAVFGEESSTITLSLEDLILDARLITGLFLGAMLPYVFSAMTILAVGSTAQLIVNEVRRQFRDIKGIMEGETDPDYETCISIATDASIKQMLLPGITAVAIPLGMAFLIALGKDTWLEDYISVETFIGLLLGSLVSSFMLAVMMANSGGAWDNAKKYIEVGNYGGKGSDAHKAAVTGDTVGDPLKDTSGPSMDIFLKLMAIIALVVAPLIANAIHDSLPEDAATELSAYIEDTYEVSEYDIVAEVLATESEQWCVVVAPYEGETETGHFVLTEEDGSWSIDANTDNEFWSSIGCETWDAVKK
jgi:K(+)-stimulated pyrophosphate-energized sodium pump